MNPGKLNRKVEIMELTKVPDGSGGYEDAFLPIKKVWANIKPIYGKEYYEAQQAQAQISHRITIRYNSVVNRAHIISFDNKLYDIQYLLDIEEEHKFLEIRVLERQ